MAILVLTVYGDDRAGLVDAISEVIAANGASWDKSYMAEMSGKFAGIVSVSVPDTKLSAVTSALEHLTGLEISVHAAREPAPAPHRDLEIELFGPDHPGIVHDLSHALAEHGVSIAELATEVRPAPMGGGLVFDAKATVHAPGDLDLAVLDAALHELANRIAVDIEVSEA